MLLKTIMTYFKKLKQQHALKPLKKQEEKLLLEIKEIDYEIHTAHFWGDLAEDICVVKNFHKERTLFELSLIHDKMEKLL
ncbi:MAG: hypothetical protein H6Q67_1865 [Firmicutes bacterium]|nr:hypothetical protein [Bacillota bacterium]